MVIYQKELKRKIDYRFFQCGCRIWKCQAMHNLFGMVKNYQLVL
ncbi:unnamed protein product [Paramecium sonneborni]|uniref:Uncharacterized protein n=1 Tax=Paramecium sonneborni TaxID=65129 RepID=A0A8S1RTC6_9CILI|nr:unnamed protein product [Paramecium sonneborni]